MKKFCRFKRDMHRIQTQLCSFLEGCKKASVVASHICLREPIRCVIDSTTSQIPWAHAVLVFVSGQWADMHASLVVLLAFYSATVTVIIPQDLIQYYEVIMCEGENDQKWNKYLYECAAQHNENVPTSQYAVVSTSHNMIDISLDHEKK